MTKVRSKRVWVGSPPALRGLGRVAFSLRYEYEAPLPAPPFVVAANHYSHFDSPVVGAGLRLPIRFLALEDLFGVNRLLDWLVTGYGAIPTPRDRHPVGATRTALSALEDGQVVGVFPESTRVSHWGVLPPKRGAAWLALRAGVPLVPTAVIGTGRVFGLENKLQRHPLRVIYGKALHPDTEDEHALMSKWSDWVGSRLADHPESEAEGPRRAFWAEG